MATKGSLGLYIDSKTVYAAFVSASQRTSCAIPIAGAAEDLDYDSKVTDAVRQASQQLAPASKTALLAIPGESAMVRCFDLPVLPKKEEGPAVRFEAQKFVPFDLKELCFDYDSMADTSKRRVKILFYAGKKAAVERHVAFIENAGLAVSAVEILSNSLARSFNQEIVKSSGSIYMLIRVDERSKAEVIVAKDQIVLLSRHITLDQIPGEANWQAAPFLGELRLSFDYFEEIFRGQSISKVYVSAPTREGMQILTESISRSFSLPVEAVSSPGSAPETAGGLAVAHGLALREITSQKGKKINLKPAIIPIIRDAAQTKTALNDFTTKALMAAAAVFGGAYILMGQFVQKAQKEINVISSGFTASETTPTTLSKNDLQIRKDLLTERLNFLSEMIGRRKFFTDKMSILAKSVPREIHLTSFAYEDDVTTKGRPITLMRMEGYTPTEESASGFSVVSKFVSVLQADKEFMNGFAQIKITSTKSSASPSGAPAVRFELECASVARTILT